MVLVSVGAAPCCPYTLNIGYLAYIARLLGALPYVNLLIYLAFRFINTMIMIINSISSIRFAPVRCWVLNALRIPNSATWRTAARQGWVRFGKNLRLQRGL